MQILNTMEIYAGAEEIVDPSNSNSQTKTFMNENQ